MENLSPTYILETWNFRSTYKNVSVRRLSIARPYDRLSCVMVKNTGLSCPSAGYGTFGRLLFFVNRDKGATIPAVEICNSCCPFCLLDLSAQYQRKQEWRGEILFR
jgi:hypothetical protein